MPFVTFPDFALFAESYRRPLLPQPASNPAPADTATNVNTLPPLLTWTSDTNSLWHDVYFGIQDPPPFLNRQTGTTFDIGSLDPNTWHYWRIDEMNPAGITTGPIWSFKTEARPLRAENPSPSHAVFGVPTNHILSWTPGQGASSHNIYFGWYYPPPFISNQTETTFDPGPLSESTAYFWRVDEVNSEGTTTGTLWIFSTRLSPARATNPDPPDGATDASTYSHLTWTPGERASSHDIYFGTTSPGTFRGSQTETTFDPGPLLTETTYYWRIDEYNQAGTTTGPVWTFTTWDLPPR